ncbi:hypothetical protein QLG07_02165 [Erwinia sp. V90_4]|uniref:hypothetical protein n=1 Tax=Erwinia sp. V90_4 TaxID=3044239 RepID=UPI00249F386A|nr:hypothetical protein [Erwinia sp. V90_4]MDI3438276.1 hypothetical protein [Erwinia sp. V90_4]
MKILIRLVLVAIIIFISIVFYYFSKPPHEIICVGNLSFIKDQQKMVLSSRIYLNGNVGSLYLKGEIHESHGIIYTVSRMVDYKSSSEGYQFDWLSTSVEKQREENIPDDISEKWLPGFYTKENNHIRIYLNRINLDSILVSGELMPYYICSF